MSPLLYTVTHLQFSFVRWT